MVRQSVKISRYDSAAARRDSGVCSRLSMAEALSGTILGSEAAPAIAGPAGNTADKEKVGGKGLPDTSLALGACRARRCGRKRNTSFADTLRCRVTWRLVSELFAAACERDLPEGAARRRPRCHIRQIAMYLCHVVLSVPYQTIANAFSRDRTTVMHACSVIEDRRDDAAYDRFVERCERCVKAVFAPLEHDNAEL
ncbi:DnaA-like protein [Hoeflea halophila]|uniref:DnaA-like protein n=1 Tax=Hoeflea halophila TaxID=714899 RepID=A0A286IBV3_9HYPH|nr:helix-turn-helix domain-containing protein [Hoeflea halophila]SOE17497.1 DnaA-like protein [Hoeflea halophila]